NARPDLEPIVPGAGKIILENITPEVDTRRVQSLFVINRFPFKSPFIGRLIPRNRDKLRKVGAQRMRQRLVIMAEVVDAVAVLIGVRPDKVGLKLQIEILDGKDIDIFKAQLEPLFIGPVSVRIMED